MHDHEPTDAMQRLADAIFHVRGRRTQAEFGELVGVTKRTIIRWEQGHAAGMRLAHVQRLRELGIAPELLLGVPTEASIVVAVGPQHRAPATDIVAEPNDSANQPTQGAA